MSRTVASSASPAATSLPPMNIAVLARSSPPAREHRPVNQASDRVRPHAAVLQQSIDAGIDRHDGVEHARLRVGVELDQDLGLRSTVATTRD